MSDHQKQIDFIAGKLGWHYCGIQHNACGPRAYDPATWRNDEDEIQADAAGFAPFTNLDDAHRVLEAAHRVVITKHHNRRYEVWIYTGDEDGFPDGSCTASDFCAAVTTAALQAWGYDDE